MTQPTDLQCLVTYVEQQLGPRDTWAKWPGGWPGKVELALIDAVFSIQARYSGVLTVVQRWRDRPRAGDLDNLNRLATSDSEQLAAVLDNRQMVPGGSQTKASAVVRAARNLVAIDVVHAAQVSDTPEQRRAYCGVPGLGPVTWTYLQMLLGASDVKADTMIQRFIASALPGSHHNAEECRQLIRGAASRLDTSATVLDHAIWNHQRRQRR